MALAVLSAGAALVAQATVINPAVSYTSSSTLTDTRAYTLGYEFTTSVAFDVNALGVWNDLLPNSHEVGLWTSTGTLLASTTIMSTDGVTGHFRYHPITDLILSPGDYVIGAEFLGGRQHFPFDAVGVVSAPGYTYVTSRQFLGSGLNFPTTAGGSYGPNGVLMADFSLGQSPVPEPLTLTLTGAGLLLIGACRKLRAGRGRDKRED